MDESSAPTGSLTALLPPEAVAAQVDAEDWEEAIRASGDLLVATGSATPAYTDQMLAAIHRYGPYIVIAPGFALAHAQASDDVLHTGMSFVQLAHPVRFGHEANDPVRLVAGLASKDHSAHMEALQQLAIFLSSGETMDKLVGATTSDELRSVLGLGKSDERSAPARRTP